MDRRTFIGCSLLGLLSSRLFAQAQALDVLKEAHTTLFPQSFDPRLDPLPYFLHILSHPRIDSEEKKLLLSGAQKIEAASEHHFGKEFKKRSLKNRHQLFAKLMRENWFQEWSRLYLNYLFEALFGDPIYGVNKGQKSWHWLGFSSPRPRPKKMNDV